MATPEETVNGIVVVTLRDYFAAQALSNSALMSQLWEVVNETTAARVAYIVADAMLRERAQ